MEEVKKGNFVGTTTQLARNLAAPRKPSELDYEALVALIQDNVAPMS